jgi:SOS-response transcriptional repressor LexA
MGHDTAMQQTLIQKIDNRLDELGITRSKASTKAGLSSTFIRDIERRGGNPTLSSLQKLAKVLKVDVEYLAQAEEQVSDRPIETLELPVVGTIEAGQFRDITIFDQEDNFPVINIVPDRRFRHARQYALKVAGDSMNLKYPNGCFVICVDFAESGLALQKGMTVHVTHTISGTHLVEITLKEIGSINGEIVLLPRSSNPKYKPITMQGGEDSEYEICGIVTGSFIPEDF